MRFSVSATFRVGIVLVGASAIPVACGFQPASEPVTTVRGALGELDDLGPAVSSWGPARLDIFWRKSQNEVSQLTFDNAWGSPAGISTPNVVGAPAAVSRSPNLIDLFWRSGDNHLHQNSYVNGSLTYATDLGQTLDSSPSAVSWGGNRLDVFYRVPGGHLHHLWRVISGTFTYWYQEDLGGTLASDPAAVSWGLNRIDVFWRGTDNHIKHKWLDGVWSGIEDLGHNLTSAPTVVSWAPARIDIFWRGTDNALKHKWFDNVWSGEEHLGGTLGSEPGAAAWGPGRIDVFWTLAAHLHHRWFPFNNGWSFDEDLGPAPQECPAHSTCGGSGSGAYCELPSGCTATTGTCMTSPTSCPLGLIAPVCGCDGRSYANDCERQAAGVPKLSDGVCSSPSCPGMVPQQGTGCTVANSACVYSGPTSGCVQRVSCTNGVWSAPAIICGFF